MQLEWQVFAVGIVVGTCFLAALAGIVFKLRGGKRRQQRPAWNPRPLQVIRVDASRIPEALHCLIPFAEEWGIADDVERMEHIFAASEEEKAEFLAAVASCRPDLTAWLQRTDVTASDGWTAMAFMETAAAEIEMLYGDEQ